MYALTALTATVAEVVREQFAMDDAPVPTREPDRRLDGARAALAAVLERAARAVAPPPRLPAWRG